MAKSDFEIEYDLYVKENYMGKAMERDGYVVIDDFLYPEVADELHSLALNSTKVDDVYPNGGYHSINYDKDNVPFEILPTIINTMQDAFNPIEDLEFDRGWTFVCNGEGEGVTPHADPAKINVNLWVTRNECVSDFQKNGLIIYDKQPPEDWPYEKYNNDPEAVEAYIKESNAMARYIPYNFNRIIIFNSKYFHKTNGVSMKSGDNNRRVNYTFMFS